MKPKKPHVPDLAKANSNATFYIDKNFYRTFLATPHHGTTDPEPPSEITSVAKQTLSLIREIYDNAFLRGAEIVQNPAKENSKSIPPALGESLIVLLCPKNRIEAVLGDLEERFTADEARKGTKRARLLYWMRVLRSVGPLALTKVRKLGLYAMVVEIGRRLIGG